MEKEKIRLKVFMFPFVLFLFFWVKREISQFRENMIHETRELLKKIHVAEEYLFVKKFPL